VTTERTSITDPAAAVPEVPGELLLWTPEEADAHPWLVGAVAAFESVDTDAGREAARWLQEDALDNDGSTKTYLIVDDGVVEGFFACCTGSVRITEAEAEGIGVDHHPELPAFLVAWVARRRDGALTGEALMLAAYGLARYLSESVGLVAFALDPLDEGIAVVWEAPPYGLRRCKTTKGRFKPPRLYIPLKPEAPSGEGDVAA